MNDYIINVPHLQSLQKRIKSCVVWTTCWLFWLYFLIPFITLASWLLGDQALANEMKWFGGYKSLLELLEIYTATLAALAVLWLCWVCYHSKRKHRIPDAANRAVTDDELCLYHLINITDLLISRSDQLTTVYFDESGKITCLQHSSVLETHGNKLRA